MPNIDPEQLRAFADDGYIVLSEIVSLDLIQAARRAIAARLEQDPPRRDIVAPTSTFSSTICPGPCWPPCTRAGRWLSPGR